MRISDDRYTRDRERYDLALRFIRHEARTRTIRTWTGLSDTRIRKLCRSYAADGGHAGVIRHRGKAPQLTSFFVRSPEMRQETAVLASILFMLGVVPKEPVSDAHRTLPGIERGAALCEAFETYQRLVPATHITFDHAVYLVVTLAEAAELHAGHCTECCCVIVMEHLARVGRRCLACSASLA